MGFYDWRLQVSLAAMQETHQQVRPQRRSERVSEIVRLQRARHRLAARAALGVEARQSRTIAFVALFFGAVMSFTSAGLAETSDEPAQFAILGIGSAPCSRVLRAVHPTAQARETDRQAMLAWAQGYLSFYNSVSEGTYDVTGGVDAAVLQEWLFDFCRQNPQVSLMNAVDQLLVDSAKHPLLKPITH